jgi:hypothetical protein
MYKLILIILALSGFLIFKVSSLHIKRKPMVKASQARKALPTAASTSNPVQKAVSSPPPSSERIKFDSLKDVYAAEDELAPIDAIEAGNLSDAELEELEAVRKQRLEIEADARAKAAQFEDKPKTWDKMTPEEKKAFEIYKKFEKNGEQNERK